MTGISSLPLAQEEGDGQSRQKFKGVSKIIGPKWSHLPTLTIGFLGIQIFWSVEMSYASPYLLSLGLSRSKMAVVFVAGPVSGLVMQPLIGVLADNCTSRFGRRRPYMMAATITCVFAMILLGFTRWFASIFVSVEDSNNLLTIWLAVFAIYFFDFAVNALTAVDRALLVDSLPSVEQPQGNAWAARMMAMGAIVGFFTGNVELTKIFPFLGGTQLQVLSVVASLLLFGTHFIMAMLVKERVLLSNTSSDRKTNKMSFAQELREIWVNIFNLPHSIQQICFIQFFASLGWFPILFYTTVYIGDLYKRGLPVPPNRDAQLALDTQATRLGSRAFFIHSIIALIANFVLPYFVMESVSNEPHKPYLRSGNVSESFWAKIQKFMRVPSRLRIHLASLWALSHLVFALCMFATFFTSSVSGASFLIAVLGFPFAVTQWAPFSLLATAILTETLKADSTVIHLADTRTNLGQPRTGIDCNVDADERTTFIQNEASESEDENVDEVEGTEERRRMSVDSHVHVSRSDTSGVENGSEYLVNGGEYENRTAEDMLGGGSLSARAGVILGIQNIFVVIPQFLVTGFSSLVFAIFDPQNDIPPHHGAPVHVPFANVTNANVLINNTTELATRVAQDLSLKWLESRQGDGGLDVAKEDMDLTYQGSNSVVYILRLGGIAASVAAVLTWRLARELGHR